MGPEDWKPPATSFHCEYAVIWITIKDTWGLTANQREWDALVAMLDTCPNTVKVQGLAFSSSSAHHVSASSLTSVLVLGFVAYVSFLDSFSIFNFFI